MTKKEALLKTKELIATPDKWTQGVDARNIVGQPVDPKSKRAVCYCLYGALIKVTNDVDDAEFNDSSTHEQVLELINKTLEDYENDQQRTAN
jgi:hypothetical protein